MLRTDKTEQVSDGTWRTWITCRLCRQRMFITVSHGFAAMWCPQCDT